ncbi:hypothetical protein HQ563_13455 [bacterium]|nr:hypothetical protein [bacterium]
MKKAMIFFEVALFVFAWCAKVNTRISFREDRPGQTVHQRPEWPEGLAELLTRGARIYGCQTGWLGRDEHSLYFSGDTDDFNWFVEQYAKLKGVSRTLGQHPGQGQANSIMNKQPVRPYDSMVSITSHYTKSGRNFDISVELWVGGEVELDRLKAPVNMEVRASGKGEEFDKIEKFTEEHNAKRK